MSLLSLCTTTCDIERKTTTASASGGQVEAFANVYDDLPCTIQPASGRTIEEHGRRGMQITHVVYTPTAISLLAGDRLIIGSTKYLVTSFGDMAGRAEAYAIYCLKKD